MIKAWVMRHFMLVFTIVLACVLRFSWLGSLPEGLSWDEAAIAYNGYGIVTVHRDEWLQRMPITFKSFGDYKAAVAIYMDAVSTTVFGMNNFAIRFPMALAGVITVGATYVIGLELFKRRLGAGVAALLVAVSPWNIQFSRIAFESGIGVAFTSVMLASLLLAKRKQWFYLLAAVCGVFALYAYHSTKIVIPLLVLWFAWSHQEELKKSMKWVVVSLIAAIILIFPLLKESVFGKATERFYMTSAIIDEKGAKPLYVLVPTITSNLMAHLSPSFLLFGETSTLRHGTGKTGVLTYLEFIFLLSALGFMVRSKNKTAIWLFVAMCIGLLPAIISNDVPHSNRAHGVVPFIQLFSAWGLFQGYTNISKTKWKIYLLPILGSFFIIQTFFYAYVYITTYSSSDAAKEFQYGYEKAVMYARQQEGDVDKVLFTSAYGQPYIYILLFKKLTPIQFHQGSLANYEIRDLNWPADRLRKRLLIVGTPKEIPVDAPNIVHEITFPNGEVAFRIVKQ